MYSHRISLDYSVFVFRLEQVFARAYNLRTSGCTLILVQTCGSAADPWDPDGTGGKTRTRQSRNFWSFLRKK